MEQDDRPIPVGTKNIGQILLSIMTRGSVVDTIHLDFTDRFAGDAEYLLRLLRKNGWRETEREKAETINSRCFYDNEDMQVWETTVTEEGVKVKKKELRKIKVCTHPEANPPRGCNEHLRNSCPFHKQKFTSKIPVTRVTIEKIPQMRGL